MNRGLASTLKPGRQRTDAIAQETQRVKALFKPAREPYLGTVVLAVVNQHGAQVPEDDLGFTFRENVRIDLARGLAVHVHDDDVGPILNAKSRGLHAAA